MLRGKANEDEEKDNIGIYRKFGAFHFPSLNRSTFFWSSLKTVAIRFLQHIILAIYLAVAFVKHSKVEDLAYFAASLDL